MNKITLGRTAGLVYLMVVLTGIFNLLYVPSQLINWQDAAQTVANIQANDFLYRLHVVAGILSYVFFAILPLLLYQLFKEVNRNQASLMVALAVISVPISLGNMVDKLNVLSLLSNLDYAAAVGAEQVNAQVMLLLRSYNNGLGVVQIFWGLWLLPLGYLIFRSGYIPKILGICLMLGCFGYLAGFFQYLLFPQATLPSFVKLPGSIGEIGTCLWLLIMSVKIKPVEVNQTPN